MSNPCLDGALLCRPIYQRTIISVSANQVLLDTTVKRVSYYTELYFSCISFYSLLVIPLINCPIKI